MGPILLSISLVFGCAAPDPAPVAPTARPAAAPAQAAPKAPPAPKAEADRTVLDVAVGSPDHTTLVAAVKAADLVNALASPGGIYTVFAPTDAAFAALPAGTVEGLLQPDKKEDLKKILKHHAGVPIVTVDQMQDGQVLTMSDGTDVTLHVKNGEVRVGEAKILGSVNAVNGVVHVVDKVLIPGA